MVNVKVGIGVGKSYPSALEDEGGAGETVTAGDRPDGNDVLVYVPKEIVKEEGVLYVTPC